MEAPPTAGVAAFAVDAAAPVAALAGDGDTPAGVDAGFAPSVPLAFAPAAAACDAAAAAGAGLDALADAADAACSLATAPVASSAGTLSTAPSFNRLGLPRMNADGFASKIDRAAWASTALSCEPVAAAAISASDCPGLTVICVEVEATGAAAAEAEAPAALCPAGAAAGVAGAAHAGDVQTSQAQAIASGTARRVERVVMKVSRACKRASRWRLG